ncbi:hypothetical protein [Hydrogenovibrio sp. JE_KL2]|uniref:hypothetical protein n=1 Tax=Hydrogenovibrio sp. JE_KL2 TaxID=2651188 RepID=UPI001562D434|nr:hypothetical protein [Hydrogenovibrio sp. JE_KL2]
MTDHAWSKEVAVFLIPTPSLSKEEKIVAMDFNMKDGILNIWSNQALLLYTLYFW